MSDLQYTAFVAGAVGIIITGPTWLTFSILLGRAHFLNAKSTRTFGARNALRTIPELLWGAVINGCNLKVKR